MLGIILLILVLLLIASWCYIQRKYSYFRDRNILYLKPTFPFGNIGQLRKVQDMNGWCRDLYFKFRGRDILGGIFIGLTPIVVMTDLDVIRDIVVRDFSSFPNHVKYTIKENSRDRLMHSLYTLQGEMWRHMRTKLSPAFSFSSMNGLFDLTLDCASNLTDFVARNTTEGRPVNAKNIFLRYVCDSVGSCGFGIDCRGTVDENPVLLNLAHQVFNPTRAGVQFYYLMYNYVAEWLPLEKWSKPTTAFVRIIDEIVEYREENNVRRNDLLQVFLDIKKNGHLIDDESGECMMKSVPQVLHAEAFALFWLGYHQISTILSWALFELACNQTIQSTAREEIRKVIQSNNGSLDYGTVEKMTYLQQVVDETLRKYPGVPLLERVSREDYITRKGRKFIEKGTDIIIPIYGIHNDPEIYPEPDRFNPDRMSKEQMSLRHPNSFFPFGDGPRLCIAQRFVYLQIKLPIIKLLSKFQISINHQTKQPKDQGLSGPDDSEIWLNVQPLL